MLRRVLILLALAPVVALADPPSQQLTAPPPKPASQNAQQPTQSPALQSPVPQTTTPAAWASPPDASECRMACANAAYVCRAGDDPDSCDPSWSMCVATCNNPNLDPGVSTAP
jgi:hypothetical protein